MCAIAHVVSYSHIEKTKDNIIIIDDDDFDYEDCLYSTHTHTLWIGTHMHRTTIVLVVLRVEVVC